MGKSRRIDHDLSPSLLSLSKMTGRKSVMAKLGNKKMRTDADEENEKMGKR